MDLTVTAGPSRSVDFVQFTDPPGGEVKDNSERSWYGPVRE
jgi:hypothetical protein